mmetsp:Transcript_5880/g.7762  ORF Transcript_5880/g.7762 Transcript_5880/m.7762 type:complete len:208 (+) Transcript_5880:394-1017(+)|eukprot:CAMPEP_0117757112 /NCGR_PEP_ID=MMETSP0947-20121206/14518_1 /TAXON_ID=44440 /ORGANISM="Chattonella subsalsa, Strain CCMP2191" /LENGTH=207 /DNA_ID=CAMNT_0005576905 /DNA_START=312 /DNA_END=935 /DNA_ORIENTATION=+
MNCGYSQILLVGDSAVGKTSLIERFSDNKYSPSFVSTIGVDFKILTLKWKDKVVKFQIWDTAGQERFRSITQSYYRGAHGIVMVYDVSDPLSLQNIQNIWSKEVERYARSDVALLMVGNKTDLIEESPSSAQLTQDISANFCDTEDIPHLKTSAKNGEGVGKAFCALVDLMVEQHRKRNLSQQTGSSEKVSLTGDSLNQSVFSCCGI